MEEDGDANVWGVMDAVPTTVVTVYFAQFQIIRTTIFCIAVISEDLTGAEEMKCSRKPKHIKDSKDNVRHNWEDYQCLNFTNDLCSNLTIVSQGQCSEITIYLHRGSTDCTSNRLLTFRTGVAISIRLTIAIEDRKAMIIITVISTVAA